MNIFDILLIGNTFTKYTDPTAHHPFGLKGPIEVEMEMLMNVCFVSLTYLCINTLSPLHININININTPSYKS